VILVSFIAVYTIILIVISITSISKIKDGKSFLLGNQSLPWFMVAAVVLGDVVGGASVMGVGQTAYNNGVGAVSFNIAVTIGLVLLGLTVAEFLRKLENTTICETMGHLFDIPVKNLTAIILTVVYFIVTCVQFVAGGAILQELLGISLNAGIAATALISLTIVSLGGLISIGLINIVNVIFVYLGLILGTLLSIQKIGGWTMLWEKLPQGFSSPATLGGSNIGAMMITTIFTCFVTQAALMGLYGARSPRDAKIGSITAGLLMLPIGVFATLIGLTARAHFGTAIPEGLRALPAMASLFPPFLSGIVFMGLWAMIISTSAPCLLATTQILTRDILPLITPIQKDNVRPLFYRIITVAIGVFCFAASLTIMHLLDVLVFTFTLRTAIAASLILALLFGKRYKRLASPAGAFWGMLSGLIIAFIWVIVLKNPGGIHEFYPTFAVFILVLSIVSLLYPRKRVLEEVSNV
jgi:solute:Na+ symporter, SSS family